MTHSERRSLIEHAPEAVPLRTQAELLGLSRASLYYQPVPPSPEEVAHKHRIDELYTAHPFYGSRRLTVLLSEEFGPLNRKRVQRYMQEMGALPHVRCNLDRIVASRIMSPDASRARERRVSREVCDELSSEA